MKFIETKFFIIFTILMIPVVFLYDDYLSGNYLNQILLFSLPLLWPGLAHGSLDILVAKKNHLIKNKFQTFLFLFIYISIPLIFFYLWIIFPNIVFKIFLLLSILHFGISDSITNQKIVETLIRGFLVIILPFKFHLEKTIDIFSFFYIKENELLNLSKYFDYLYIILILLITFFLIQNYKKVFSHNKFSIFIIEMICLFFCFWFFEPLISFFIYFCFLHSTRHLIDEKRNLELNKKNLFIKTLPMTILTIIFFTSLFFYFNDNPNNLNVSILVIGLSSLTIPHILLINLTKKD